MNCLFVLNRFAVGTNLLHARQTTVSYVASLSLVVLLWDTCIDQPLWLRLSSTFRPCPSVIGFLATILMRVLKNDFIKYSREDDTSDEQEETGWKYIHGDVFRFPPCIKYVNHYRFYINLLFNWKTVNHLGPVTLSSWIPQWMMNLCFAHKWSFFAEHDFCFTTPSWIMVQIDQGGIICASQTTAFTFTSCWYHGVVCGNMAAWFSQHQTSKLVGVVCLQTLPRIDMLRLVAQMVVPFAVYSVQWLGLAHNYLRWCSVCSSLR